MATIMHSPCSTRNGSNGHDRQGSIIATTNSSGAVVNEFKCGPYGESAALVGTTFGFTGQRYDAETGLYYYKRRQYSPSLGRFLQPDSLRYVDTLNLYSYVSNDPLNRVDFLGQNALAIVGLTLAELVALVGAALALQMILNNIGKGIPTWFPPEKLPGEIPANAPPPYTPINPCPHTEVGTRNAGKKFPYPQAREWGWFGEWIKDIDWSDHGDPDDHEIPHQHEPDPNTGGRPPKGGPFVAPK